MLPASIWLRYIASEDVQYNILWKLQKNILHNIDEKRRNVSRQLRSRRWFLLELFALRVDIQQSNVNSDAKIGQCHVKTKRRVQLPPMASRWSALSCWGDSLSQAENNWRFTEKVHGKRGASSLRFVGLWGDVCEECSQRDCRSLSRSTREKMKMNAFRKFHLKSLITVPPPGQAGRTQRIY